MWQEISTKNGKEIWKNVINKSWRNKYYNSSVWIEKVCLKCGKKKKRYHVTVNIVTSWISNSVSGEGHGCINCSVSKKAM